MICIPRLCPTLVLLFLPPSPGWAYLSVPWLETVPNRADVMYCSIILIAQSGMLVLKEMLKLIPITIVCAAFRVCSLNNSYGVAGFASSQEHRWVCLHVRVRLSMPPNMPSRTQNKFRETHNTFPLYLYVHFCCHIQRKILTHSLHTVNMLYVSAVCLGLWRQYREWRHYFCIEL